MSGHGGPMPSDHYCSRYRETCAVCGRWYHAEDGGCDCTVDLDDCACAANAWKLEMTDVDDGRIICSACGTEPGAELEETGDED